jgi:hypothetical protein
VILLQVLTALVVVDVGVENARGTEEMTSGDDPKWDHWKEMSHQSSCPPNWLPTSSAASVRVLCSITSKLTVVPEEMHSWRRSPWTLHALRKTGSPRLHS